jgi:hypothetical protein
MSVSASVIKMKVVYVMNNIRILLRMASSGMLRRVTLVRTDGSGVRCTSIIRVTRIDELGTTLAVTGNGRTLLALFLVHRFLSS